MKTLIVYRSKCGSTKKYAEDIAQAVGGEAIPLAKGWKKKAKEADCLVFGGFVQAGVIQGLDKFLAEYDSFGDIPVLVYAVGMAYPTKEGRDDLITMNLLDMYHIRFYQVQGSFDINKLGWFSKLMMKRVFNQMANKEGATANEQMLADLISRPLLVYDHDKINRIIEVINKLSLEVHPA